MPPLEMEQGEDWLGLVRTVVHPLRLDPRSKGVTHGEEWNDLLRAFGLATQCDCVQALNAVPACVGTSKPCDGGSCSLKCSSNTAIMSS